MSQEIQPPPESTNLERAIEDATRAVVVETNRLDNLEAGKPSGEPLGIEGLRDVPVSVSIELGRARLPLAEVLALAPGSLVMLDRAAHDPVDAVRNTFPEEAPTGATEGTAAASWYSPSLGSIVYPHWRIAKFGAEIGANMAEGPIGLAKPPRI
jgi:hypothetical protein